MHYLGWPFLAALAELERTRPGDPAGWDEARIRRALTFYLLHTPHELQARVVPAAARDAARDCR